MAEQLNSCVYQTLDEYVKKVEAIESRAAEPEEASLQIRQTAKLIGHLARKFDNIKIITDYDADGITFGYIMKKTLDGLGAKNVSVVVNDRRGEYGVPKSLVASPDTLYIIGDMGCNELDYIQATFADSEQNNIAVVIDHHIINDDKTKDLFNSDPHYLNLHSIVCADGKSPEYCAAGLAFRIFEEIKGIYEAKGLAVPYDQRTINTLMGVAGIGTISDMVSVLDEHSKNREIIKNAMNVIRNADENNFDFVWGNLLNTAGLTNEITAQQIGFNVGAFLNSASRMSELLGQNGAQRTMDTLLAPVSSAETYLKIEQLSQINNERKDSVKVLQSDKSYDDFISQCRNGELKDKNVVVYELPKGTASAFAGLIANKMVDAVDKTVIVITETSEGWKGSGRNVSGMDNLKEFIDKVGAKDGLEITAGGHANAIGISHINDGAAFKAAVDELQADFTRNMENVVRLSMAAEEISSQKTVETLKALEPMGTGLTLPPVEVEGELTQNKCLANNSKWHSFKINNVPIKDWNYVAENYTPDENGNVKVLADIALTEFNGLRVEPTVRYDSAFAKERELELSANKSDAELSLNG